MIEWQHFKVGNSRQPCPECGRGPKDTALSVTMQANGSGIAHCFRCGHVESYTPQGVSVLQPGAPPPKNQKRAALADNWMSLWEHARPIKNTLAERYLTLRGCALPPAGAHLKFMSELQHPKGWAGPAMLALVTDAIDLHPMTLHRTWIQDGNPKPLDRRLLGGHEKKGGVIRLWPDDYVTYGLAIAEGIETTLSLASVYKPVWSLVDAGNMAAFPVLKGIECLLIGADYDCVNKRTGKRAGWDAAQACAKRWRAAGCEVEVITTGAEKTDINDMENAA